MVILWSRLHIDFAGPLNGVYQMVVLDSYTKRPAICKGRKTTTKIAFEFLDEIPACLIVSDTIVSGNETQFTAKEFKYFSKMHQMEHVTTPPYNPRPNG